jgi:decaprenylphospho-beta-D-erythro-pentofuranosid-2-ulose 2-reductase
VFPKIVIVGATSAIAEHCARLWLAESPKNLVLVGRDQTRTERVARDLRIRSPNSRVTVHTVDFTNPLQIHELVDKVCRDNVPDIVLIAHGTLPDQVECQTDLVQNQQILHLNGVSPVLFAEAFVGHMANVNRGKLAIIGSVAGDRGRKSNYVYGASKAMLARYVQGMQHRFYGTNVKVILIKPGPTDTPMTAHLNGSSAKLADVSAVASCIIRGIERTSYIIYAPAKWGVIMMVIKHLPQFIFNKMDI